MTRAWRAHPGWMSFGFFGPLLGMVVGMAVYFLVLRGLLSPADRQSDDFGALAFAILGFPLGIFLPALAGAMTGSSAAEPNTDSSVSPPQGRSSDGASMHAPSRAKAALRGSSLFVLLCILGIAAIAIMASG